MYLYKPFFFFYKPLQSPISRFCDHFQYHLINIHRQMSGPPIGIEPPTTGRVILHTARGLIEFELWCKETPIACHNFLQRCSEGYYDGSTFHRVIRNFIVQGGSGWRDNDDTSQSNDNRSSKGFPDEFHSRLKFNKRGILGTANIDGVRNSNGSQFIITLAAEGAPSLNRKNTVFGRITPQTIYTLVEIGSDVETVGKPGEDDDDVPLYPVKILGTEIVEPYFDDIEPKKTGRAAGDTNDKNNTKQNVTGTQTKKSAVGGLIKKRGKVTQKVKVSYSNEDEEEETNITGKKRRFEIKVPIAVSKKKKKQKDEQNITKAQDLVNVPVKDESPIPKDLKNDIETENARDKVSTETNTKDSEETEMQSVRDIDAETKGVSQLTINRVEQRSAKELNEEFERLKSEFKNKSGSKPLVKDKSKTRLRDTKFENDDDDIMDTDMSKYISRKKKIAVKGSENRELETLQLLNRFNSKLKTSAKRVGTFTADTKTEGVDNAYDSDSAGSGLSEEETQDPYDLYSHKFGQPSSLKPKDVEKKDIKNDRQAKFYDGVKLSQKDAGLITQDDYANRRAAKYSMTDPENKLRLTESGDRSEKTNHNTNPFMSKTFRDKERKANQERKARLMAKNR